MIVFAVYRGGRRPLPSKAGHVEFKRRVCALRRSGTTTVRRGCARARRDHSRHRGARGALRRRNSCDGRSVESLQRRERHKLHHHSCSSCTVFRRSLWATPPPLGGATWGWLVFEPRPTDCILVRSIEAARDSHEVAVKPPVASSERR